MSVATLNASAATRPRPMSVNMFGERFTSDCHARTNNGHPAITTVGIARIACKIVKTVLSSAWRIGMFGKLQRVAITLINERLSSAWRIGMFGKNMSAIARISSGPPSIVPKRNRHVKSRCSGSGVSSSVAAVGSSAMPHFGQVPGPIRSTSGCMGQVYFTPATASIASVCPPRYFAGFCMNLRLHISAQK